MRSVRGSGWPKMPRRSTTRNGNTARKRDVEGEHRLAYEGAWALVSEFSGTPSDAPPQPVQRLALNFGHFREDRNSVRRLVDVATRTAERRADLTG